MNVGRIIIDYEAADDGDLVTSFEVEGDLPVVVLLGLLDLTRDSLLHPDDDD